MVLLVSEKTKDTVTLAKMSRHFLHEIVAHLRKTLLKIDIYALDQVFRV